MKNLILWFAAAIVLLVASFAGADAAEEAAKPEKAAKLFSPSRIEKILESPQRDQWQQPDRVIGTLAPEKGAVVADIGAGSGYFSFRLAEAVGPKGKIFAVDIQDEMLDYIRQKASRTGASNVIPVKATATDPHLPAACCDLILLVNTYHELTEPVALMKNLRKALKPGGTVAIINWNRHGRRATILPDTIIADLKLAGFTLSATHDFLERQFFLVFNPA